MSRNMPDNGLHIVMFTHQDASVWADMAAIVWGAGLQVTTWYVATETRQLKKGGYVQGTVLLVLRQRSEGESVYRDELVQEVRTEVATQIRTMTGLNQSTKGAGRSETSSKTPISRWPATQPHSGCQRATPASTDRTWPPKRSAHGEKGGRDMVARSSTSSSRTCRPHQGRSRCDPLEDTLRCHQP